MAIQHTNVTVIRYVDVMIANPHPARFLVTVSVNNFIMDKKKLKRAALINLIAGYTGVVLLIVLVMLNQPEKVIITEPEVTDPEGLFSEVHEDIEVEKDREVAYIGRHPIVIDNSVGPDRLHGVILDDDPDVVVLRDNIDPHVAVVGNSDHVVLHDRDDKIYIDNDRGVDIIDGHEGVYNRNHIGRNNHGGTVVRDGHTVGNRHDRVITDDDIGVVDLGALDRAIREDEANIDLLDRRLAERAKEIGIDIEDDDINVGQLTLARDGDDVELGDLDLEPGGGDGEKGYGIGKGGELYAYNFPSRGVGAGIGNSAIGAGAGGGAGLGAGIGEGVLNGETVPTLGGVGTYSSVPVVAPGTGTDTDGDGLTAAAESALGTDPTKPDSDGDGYVDGAEIEAGTSPRDANSNPGIPGSESLPALGGTGGLVGGAGAGGAAGLTTGMVKEKIGIGIGPGKGCAEHGGNCDGHHGHGHHNYDHLPKDGALHIMMHVDGSGSILNTRKQLEIMKDTVLKAALLPYYNNSEELYGRRVTIIDSAGERTLRFFTEAAKKDNVLALVFQDEAQPAYHLPNFNRKPEDQYLDDLGKLKASLNGYGGLYRGVMFQVDRGRTFAKSFKEFVECAWQGSGYLKGDNLKKYYWEENRHHIKNKDGVVFSDVYHAKDEGDPQYYLNLIFEASKRVGVDLNIYGAGLTDGRHNSKID